MNAIVERWELSVEPECLNRLVRFGECPGAALFGRTEPTSITIARTKGSATS